MEHVGAACAKGCRQGIPREASEPQQGISTQEASLQNTCFRKGWPCSGGGALRAPCGACTQAQTRPHCAVGPRGRNDLRAAALSCTPAPTLPQAAGSPGAAPQHGWVRWPQSPGPRALQASPGHTIQDSGRQHHVMQEEGGTVRADWRRGRLLHWLWHQRMRVAGCKGPSLVLACLKALLLGSRQAAFPWQAQLSSRAGWLAGLWMGRVACAHLLGAGRA